MIMFMEALQFMEAIISCYNKHTTFGIFGCVPPCLTWHNYQVFIDCLIFIAFFCALNQSCPLVFLSDALHYAISVSL
jgi:hypothetical protein